MRRSNIIGLLAAAVLGVCACGDEPSRAPGTDEEVYCVNEVGERIDDSKCDDDVPALGGG